MIYFFLAVGCDDSTLFGSPATIFGRMYRFIRQGRF
jgi:hypothetical protein